MHWRKYPVDMQFGDRVEIHPRPGLYLLGVWGTMYLVTTSWVWHLLRTDQASPGPAARRRRT